LNRSRREQAAGGDEALLYPKVARGGARHSDRPLRASGRARRRVDPEPRADIGAGPNSTGSESLRRELLRWGLCRTFVHQFRLIARRKRDETEKDEARRQREGDIASASARYSVALGETYDPRDPYGSLARAAMHEYGSFHRRQEEMRDQIANEKDPGKRREIELKREIEGCDYMAITSDRLAGMSAVIAGREDAPQAMLDRERARAYHDRAMELREERSQLIEAREKQERIQVAGQLHELGRSVQAGDTGKTNDKLAELERMEGAYAKRDAQKRNDPDRDDGKTNDTKTQENKTNDIKRDDDQAPASGRKEGPEPELTDAKRDKLAKLADMEGAYAKRDAQKKNDPDRDDGGGRGGRAETRARSCRRQACPAGSVAGVPPTGRTHAVFVGRLRLARDHAARIGCLPSVILRSAARPLSCSAHLSDQDKRSSTVRRTVRPPDSPSPALPDLDRRRHRTQFGR
jgi:hypothetical protein